MQTPKQAPDELPFTEGDIWKDSDGNTYEFTDGSWVLTEKETGGKVEATKE